MSGGQSIPDDSREVVAGESQTIGEAEDSTDERRSLRKAVGPMNDKSRCPVCRSTGKGCSCKKTAGFPLFECDICGRYTMIPELLNPQTWDIGHWNLSPLQRAVLSHHIRICSEDSSTAGSQPFTITPGVLNSLRSNGKLHSDENLFASENDVDLSGT